MSRLRLVNPAEEEAEVTIRGCDDAGLPGEREISVPLDAGEAMEISAAESESGYV